MSASEFEATQSERTTPTVPSLENVDGLACEDLHPPHETSYGRFFGDVPILDSVAPQRTREVQESNPYLVPRKQEQLFTSNGIDEYELPAFKTSDFPHRMCPPNPQQSDPWEKGRWKKEVNPDGTMYFHKIYKVNNGSLSIITEARLYADDELEEVNSFANYMWHHIKLARHHFTDPRHLEVVLNVKIDMTTDKTIWSYYFVDHSHRVLFWMRNHKPNHHLYPARRLITCSPEHLRYLLQAMYWEHCALYPHHGGSSDHTKLVTELSWCAAESVIAPIRYTAPYTADEAVRLRDQLDYLWKNADTHPHCYMAVAGRVISCLELWRYDDFYGTEVMRHFRGQSILEPRRDSALYRVITPLLFYAPLSHLFDCRSVYLDGNLANEPEWATHVKKLLSEWEDLVLYATILLNANVAFLAVPTAVFFVGTSTTTSSATAVSPYAITSCCSLLASIGSMTVGLLLVRQHRGEEVIDNPRTNKATFMHERRSTRFEFELLSILYSLPYVLLMWSILLFLSALMVFVLSDSDSHTRAITGIALIFIVLLVLWCIGMGWSSSPDHGFFLRCWTDSMATTRASAARVMVTASLGVAKKLSHRTTDLIRIGIRSVARLKSERKCTEIAGKA
ncbi:hypothetical protein PENSPDRAFT_648795 [Peniophora sp. CONT]|nr:hypothetical protein PENSPDRAFT_648795 [Peniophora sp. CONT]